MNIVTTLIAVALLFAALPACTSSFAATVADDMSAAQLLAASQDAAQQAQAAAGRKPKADKKDWASVGREYAERCIALTPDNAECYYWRAVNIGLYHQIKVLGYQKGIKQMIADCDKVIALGRETYDNAGAYRIPGEIYTQLPETTGHPDGITRDLEKGEQLLRHAITLAPGYPENRLALAQNLFMQDRFDEAFDELMLAKEQAPKFRIDSSYGDWQKSIASLMKKLGKKK